MKIGSTQKCPTQVCYAEVSSAEFRAHIWIYTIADGILDRLVHNAHRIEMRGESMRKKRNPPQDEKKE